MAITKIQSESLNLADTYAFTGTVTGAGVTNKPAFFVELSGNQSLSGGSSTLAAFATEIYDTDNAFDNTSGNYKFVAPSAGKYFFNYGVRWDFNNSNRGSVDIKINGSAHHNCESSNYDRYSSTNGSCFADLSANDYVQIFFYQDSGAVGEARSDATYFGGFKLF